MLVARFMEEARGAGRGSYIWGPYIFFRRTINFENALIFYIRSKHNTRIERLWYDTTEGFSQKWKIFFFDLETNHGLDPEKPALIWLLHALFLDQINKDIVLWVAAWNRHAMTIRGERRRSPLDMFFFGMIQNGPRGQEAWARLEQNEPMEWEPEHDELSAGELAQYGVEELENRQSGEQGGGECQHR